MKKLSVVLTLFWCSVSASAQMDCFGIIAGAGATADGSVMVGHNEDERGEQMPNVYSVPSGEDHCAYLWFEFPGMECADSYLNEFGVCITSDACPSREDVQTGEVVYQVRTEVARHAASAREGVRIIGRMVEEKGYKDSGRTYLVADTKEGWVCSVVRGRHWVARRVPDDMVMVIPNHYVIDEVDLSDTLNYLGSPDIIAYAVSRGWYDPVRDGAFNFSKAYSSPGSLHHPHNKLRQETGQRLMRIRTGSGDSSYFASRPDRKVKKGDFVDALTAAPILNDATCLSTIFVLNGRFGPRGGCMAHSAFGSQIKGHKYAPLTVGTALADTYHRFSTPEEAFEKHFTDTGDYRKKYPDHFYWRYVDSRVDRNVGDPDYLIYEPKGESDTYNDHFHVIYDDARDTYYAFWTQASIEGYYDQHVAFSRSTDGGGSWSRPVILAGSPNLPYCTLVGSWQIPMLSRSGRLYCLWNQQTTSARPLCGMLFGRYSDDGGQTWTPPKMIKFTRRMDMDPEDPAVPPTWCIWQRPLRLGVDGKYLTACSRHGQAPYDEHPGCKVEFWQFENIDEDPEIEDIRISFFNTDKDSFDASRVAAPRQYLPLDGPAVEEAGIVALPDGRLFAVMRSSLGYPLWTQSYDRGRTWSEPEVLLDRDGGTPFLHPRSPCPIYDLKGPEAASGEYFVLIHNTFDFDCTLTAYQNRGPLYMIRGEFHPEAGQPVWFSEPELFFPRESSDAFYSSYTFGRGEGVLWFNDYKYWLKGKIMVKY